jgi:hypothetical protein
MSSMELFGLCACLALGTQLIHLFLSEVFDTDISVLSGTRADQFIKFCLDRCAVPVLGILD